MVTLLFVCLSLDYIYAFSYSYSLTVINNVNTCPGGQYPSIKAFSNLPQQDFPNGTTLLFYDSQFPGYTGLGIQENGEYCRSNGTETGCLNPDNAGMQIMKNSVTPNSCKTSFNLNDPFYCGAHPPNAKNIIDFAFSGTWPDCTVILTRKANAPGCQTSC